MFKLKNRCYNGGNKHKFNARYTEVPSGLKFERATGVNLKELLFYKKYVGDVCEWCGKTALEEKNAKDKD